MDSIKSIACIISQIIPQVLATGITIGLIACLVKWYKDDEKKRVEAEIKAQKKAWAAEIERAGRRMMEQDTISKILKENAIKTVNENAVKKDPPLRKATGLYSGEDAQKIVKYKG